MERTHTVTGIRTPSPAHAERRPRFGRRVPAALAVLAVGLGLVLCALTGWESSAPSAPSSARSITVAPRVPCDAAGRTAESASVSGTRTPTLVFCR